MGLTLQVDEARQLDKGIWKARLPASEIRFLGPSLEKVGALSIVLLAEDPVFDPQNCSLSFRLASVQLLNMGTSDSAILLRTGPGATLGAASKKSAQTATATGDAKFLQSLPPELKTIGTELLGEVRKQFQGDLVFYPKSGRYVETPDNFWTVRPQPRDRSFRVTVRGRPESFTTPRSIKLKPDMTGYSSFKVERASQIGELISVLAQVRRN